MTSIIIPGKPFAKQRPRMTRQGRAYTPKETVSFERQVATLAAQKFSDPLEGPLNVKVFAYFEIPKSWSKKKKTEAIAAAWHTQKPDADNVIKAILDGLNRIAWHDDKQVCVIGCEKLWVVSEPRTVVSIERAQ